MNAGEKLLNMVTGRKNPKERIPVLLEDLKEGIWETTDGRKRIRVITLEPFDVLDCSTDQALFFQDGLEGLRGKFEDEGYRYSAVQPKADISGDSGELGPVVVSIDVARTNKRRGSETVSAENEDTRDRSVEKQRLYEEMENLEKQIFSKLKKMTEILQGTENEEAKAVVLRLSDETSGLYQESLTEEEVMKRMQTILTQADTLLVTMQEKKPVERGSARTARRAAARASGEAGEETALGISGAEDVAMGNAATTHTGNLEALLKAKETAPPAPISDRQSVDVPVDTLKPKTERKSRAGKTEKLKKELVKDEPKAGDTGGPEGPEDFGRILEDLWTKVSSLIEALKTPEEYAAFRNGMTPADKSGKRHFLGLKDIKFQTKTEELTGDQLKQVYAVEERLEKATQKKFFEIKNSILKDLSQRWRTELNGAVDTVTLEALAVAWSGEEAVPMIWKEVFEYLSKVDQDVVTTDYVKRLAEFQNELQEKRWQMSIERELLSLLNIADPVKAREKVSFLQSVIIGQYEEYVRDMQREAKKIKPNGTISPHDCWALWQEHGGEAKLEEAIAKHLHVFHDVDSEVGKKIFHILANGVKQETNKGA